MTNQEAEAWSQVYRDGRDFKALPRESIVRFLSFVRSSEKPRYALDIGCGTGQLTRELAQSQFVVTGIDFSDVAISVAKTTADIHHVTDVTYLKFDIEHDDIAQLPGQPYALVTCKAVFAFIERKAQLLTTVSNLLQPDGVFIIITPTIGESPVSSRIAVDRNWTLNELTNHFDVEAYDHDGLTYFVSKLCKPR